MIPKVSSTPVEAKLANIDKSSCCQSLMAYSYANKDSKSSQFDWSKKKKNPCPDWSKEANLICQLKCKWGYSCTTLIGQGKSQAFGWNKILETLVRVSESRNSSGGRQLPEAFPWSSERMRGPCLAMTTGFCLCILAQLVTRSPF